MFRAPLGRCIARYCVLCTAFSSTLRSNKRGAHFAAPFRPQHCSTHLPRHGSFECTGIRNFAAAAAKKQHYECSECGYRGPQSMAKCPKCGEWNTVHAVEVESSSSKQRSGGGAGMRSAADADGAVPARRGGAWVDGVDAPVRLTEVNRSTASHRLRLSGTDGSCGTGAEMDRVLGGGVVPGSLVLIGGDPGVGKSTLLLQVVGMLAKQYGGTAQHNGAAQQDNAAEVDNAVLYISGEESVEQIWGRADRLALTGLSNIMLLCETNLQRILKHIQTQRPLAVVIDSIQTMFLDEINSSAGSVPQVRECATALCQIAKRTKVPIFVIGHVTRAGDIGGPKALEHIVDVVLFLEGDRQLTYRMLRGMKNRFGSTDEVGVFSMNEAGLQVVHNPSRLFLDQRVLTKNVSSAVAAIMEGTRPLLLEVQALCAKTAHVQQGQEAAPPKRVPSGVSGNRFSMIIAVLQRYARMRLYAMDVYLNVIGGMAMREPAADVAIAMAIASSYFQCPVPPDVAFVGEIGLAGELRPVVFTDKRLMEAAKLGFRACVVPATGCDDKLLQRYNGYNGSMQLLPCTTLSDVLESVLRVHIGAKEAGVEKATEGRNNGARPGVAEDERLRLLQTEEVNIRTGEADGRSNGARQDLEAEVFAE